MEHNDPALSPETHQNSPEAAATEPPAPSASRPPGLTRAGAAWVATGVALVLLVVLIVFILQNQTNASLQFLNLSGSLPVGVAMLIAAVAGGALVAIAGMARVLQLRRALHRTTGPLPRP